MSAAAAPLEAYTGPDAWYGKDLQQHPEKWVHVLTSDEVQFS